MMSRLDRCLGLLVLLIIANSLGLGCNRLRQASLPLWAPPPVSHPWDLNLLSVRQEVAESRSTLMDARPASRYAEGHLPGAVNLPAAQFDVLYPRLQLGRSRPLVVYCDNAGCPKADAVRLLLLNQGHPQVRVFRAGISAWRKEGLPLER